MIGDVLQQTVKLGYCFLYVTNADWFNNLKSGLKPAIYQNDTVKSIVIMIMFKNYIYIQENGYRLELCFAYV